jgi:uncharacterized membrane protein
MNDIPWWLFWPLLILGVIGGNVILYLIYNQWRHK